MNKDLIKIAVNLIPEIKRKSIGIQLDAIFSNQKMLDCILREYIKNTGLLEKIDCVSYDMENHNLEYFNTLSLFRDEARLLDHHFLFVEEEIHTFHIIDFEIWIKKVQVELIMKILYQDFNFKSTLEKKNRIPSKKEYIMEISADGHEELALDILWNTDKYLLSDYLPESDNFIDTPVFEDETTIVISSKEEISLQNIFTYSRGLSRKRKQSAEIIKNEIYLKLRESILGSQNRT